MMPDPEGSFERSARGIGSRSRGRRARSLKATAGGTSPVNAPGLGGIRTQVVTKDSHQISTPINRKDNENEEEREPGSGNRTTTTRLAQIEFVQCGRQSLQAGQCLSCQGSRWLACIGGRQRHWPHILPGPRAQLGWRESNRVTNPEGSFERSARGIGCRTKGNRARSLKATAGGTSPVKA